MRVVCAGRSIAMLMSDVVGERLFALRLEVHIAVSILGSLVDELAILPACESFQPANNVKYVI